MPEMDGVETFHAMKQMEASLNADTPVIMLTANAIAGMHESYLQDGFSDYLSKPVQRSHLKEMIRKYLPKEYQADSEKAHHPEKKENESTIFTSEKLGRLDFLDTQNGMMYCGDNEDFYFEMLKTYLENDKTQILKQCYAQQDWKQYGIHAHSLKSTSLSIGADRLSKHAKEMEMAIKEGRLDFVQQEHDSLLKEYKELLQKIEAVTNHT